jgi:chlorophyll(ide) b reductase
MYAAFAVAQPIGLAHRHACALYTSRRPCVSMTVSSRLGVVITGGTKGVGYALAAQFVRSGDRVVICSRNAENVRVALQGLESVVATSGAGGQAFGTVADVSQPADVTSLGKFASGVLSMQGVHSSTNRLDMWVNNAGAVGTRGKLSELSQNDVVSVVSTNLLGTLLCCKEAESLMGKAGGHCFSMDGAGSAGNATAGYVAYGATKRAIPQMVASLAKEFADSNCHFHVLSPGMVLTDLLLSGNANDNSSLKFFNFLAEEPETVARSLVPRMRSIALSSCPPRSAYVKYLTLPRAFAQIAAGFLFGFRANRYFDSKTGERVDKAGEYNSNRVRVLPELASRPNEKV